MVDPMNLCTKNHVQTFMSHGSTIDVPRWTDEIGTLHGRTIDVPRWTDENGTSPWTCQLCTGTDGRNWYVSWTSHGRRMPLRVFNISFFYKLINHYDLFLKYL